MKTIRILMLALLVAAVSILWFYFHRPADQPPTSFETSPAAETTEGRNWHPLNRATRPDQSSNLTVNSSAPKPQNNPTALSEHRRKLMEEDLQKGLNEWRTPIEFYGKVVDENTNPVANASVHLVWTDISQEGNSEKDTASDTDGLFSLRNTTGKNLIVQVSKEGYYSYQRFGVAFNYAGENQNFVPNAANPVIFRLKKKGVADPLVSFKRNFQISISGKPLEIDLKTGMAVPPGQGNIIVEFVKQSPQSLEDRLYDWSFKITVPNGGLVLSTNELDFLAPTSGYEPSELIQMKSSSEDGWQSRMKRQYFVRLPDGKYARIILDLMSHNGSLEVQAFSNPSGSPNLEFDPQMSINAGVQ